MAQYVVEYDENSFVWLVDVATKARVPLAHGTILEVEGMTPPRVPATRDVLEQRAPCRHCRHAVPVSGVHQRLQLCALCAARGCLAFCVCCGQSWPEHGPAGKGCATWLQEATEPSEVLVRRLRDSGRLDVYALEQEGSRE